MRSRPDHALAALIAIVVLMPVLASPVSGYTFEAEQAVPLPSSFLSVASISVASWGTRVRVAWVGQLQQGGFGVGYAASNDGGVTFESPPSPLLTSADTSSNAIVVATPNRDFLYASRSSSGVTILRETFEGVWLGPYTPLSFSQIGAFDLTVITDGAAVFWSDLSSPNGSLRWGTLGPPTFGLGSWQVVDDVIEWAKVDPRIRVVGDEVFLVWRRSSPDGSRTMFAHGQLGNLSSPQVVNPLGDLHTEFYPELVVGPTGRVLVTFRDATAGYVVGAIAEPPYLSFEPFDFGRAMGGEIPDAPALGVDSQGRLLVAWLDGDLATQTGGFRVMFTESNADWRTFAPPQRLDADTTTGSKDGPVLEVNPTDQVLVAWGDRRQGQGPPSPYLSRAPPVASVPFGTVRPWTVVVAAVAVGLTVGGSLYATRVLARRRSAKVQTAGPPSSHDSARMGPPAGPRAITAGAPAKVVLAAATLTRLKPHKRSLFGRYRGYPVSVTEGGLAENYQTSFRVAVADAAPAVRVAISDRARIRAIGLNPRSIGLDGNTSTLLYTHRPLIRTKADDIPRILDALVGVAAAAGGSPTDVCMACRNARAPDVILVDGVPTQLCDADFQKLSAAYEQRRAMLLAVRPNYLAGLAYGSLGVIIGALVWMGIALATGYIYSVVAFGMAGLIGYLLARGTAVVTVPVIALMGALTMLAIFLGDLLQIAVIIVQLGGPFDLVVAFQVYIEVFPTDSSFGMSYFFGILGILGVGWYLAHARAASGRRFEVVV